jgi:F-type H+-transporting ATPase subunit a
MIIGLFSLIFIFGESGKQVMLGHSIGIFSTLFVLCISLLELFVAILQAFVFTLLTTVFIGQAIEEPEHHH